MKQGYAVTIIPDENGTYVITFDDVPEAISVGSDNSNLMEYATDALIAALGYYIEEKRLLPEPSEPKRNQLVVDLPLLVKLKLKIYQVMKEKNISQLQLAKKLGIDPKQVRRMLDLDHDSKIGPIENALAALGQNVYLDFNGDRSVQPNYMSDELSKDIALLREVVSNLPDRSSFVTVDRSSIQCWFDILQGNSNLIEGDELDSWKILAYQALWICVLEGMEGKRPISDFKTTVNIDNLSDTLIMQWNDIVSISRRNGVDLLKPIENCFLQNRGLLHRCLEHSVLELHINKELSYNLSYTYLALLELKDDEDWTIGAFDKALHERYGTMFRFSQRYEFEESVEKIWEIAKDWSEAEAFPCLSAEAVGEILFWYEMVIGRDSNKFNSISELLKDIHQELIGITPPYYMNSDERFIIAHLCDKWISITNSLDEALKCKLDFSKSGDKIIEFKSLVA